MTPSDELDAQAVYELLMKANEAEAALSDEEHPGVQLASMFTCALQRLADDTGSSSPGPHSNRLAD